MTLSEYVEGDTTGSDAKIYLIQRAHFFLFPCTQQPPDGKDLRIHITVFCWSHLFTWKKNNKNENGSVDMAGGRVFLSGKLISVMSKFQHKHAYFGSLSTSVQAMADLHSQTHTHALRVARRPDTTRLASGRRHACLKLLNGPRARNKKRSANWTLRV
jgi:uncharacterized protein YeaC (DUF1315 family)